MLTFTDESDSFAIDYGLGVDRVWSHCRDLNVRGIGVRLIRYVDVDVDDGVGVNDGVGDSISAFSLGTIRGLKYT